MQTSCIMALKLTAKHQGNWKCKLWFVDGTKVTVPVNLGVNPFPTVGVIVKNAENNEPIPSGKVEVTNVQNPRIGVAKADLAEDGKVSVKLKHRGKHTILVKAEGFISQNVTLDLQCEKDTCYSEHTFILTPDLPPGKTRVTLSWQKKEPKDLDLNIYAIKKSDNVACRTYWKRKKQCASVMLDVDNRAGGPAGGETITLEDNTVNKDYVYLVGIEDFRFVKRGAPFMVSGAMVTITNEKKQMDKKLPVKTEKPVTSRRP